MTSPHELEFPFADLPEVSETFADSFGGFSFDGALLRVTLNVTRLDAPEQGKPPSGKRYPACRLVLTAKAAQDLCNCLNQLAAVLGQAQKAQAKSPVRH